jgi:thiamine-phosphate pyrophosphorylase
MSGRERARAALDTDLYGITCEEHSLGRGNIEVVSEMLRAGIRLVQYRDKHKPTGAKHRECVAIRRLTREAGATLVINDHPALAMMVEADGVHLGQDDYPVEEVRRLVGEAIMIGVSTHAPAQAEAAIRAGADYLGIGPLFSTTTKQDVCAPVGLAYLDHAVRSVGIPFVAIGGIKVGHVAEVRRRGARCLALVTEITAAPDIGAKVAEIRAAR